MKEHRSGDTFPGSKNPKWGSMDAGKSHLSEEWHGMEAGDSNFSDKWDDLNPSKGHMSDKWVDMEAGEPMGNQWNEMKQERRQDPYSMTPSEGNRQEAEMAKQSKNDMKNGGHGRYEIRGSEGQSGRGL